MTVTELIDTFLVPETQVFAIYDLVQDKEIFRGTGDEFTDPDILNREVASIDNLDYHDEEVLTINVEGDE